MRISLKPLREQVLVITGASSGIGLATAREAARQGARLVLVARSEDTLADIVQQIAEQGGQAIHVAADVGRRDEVERVAEITIQHFGGFDTWVNDAGTSIYGHLWDVSDEDSRRMFDTNFWGIVHGSLVALDHLKDHGGTLINLGSVTSDVAHPLQGMYSASKHAVKGFTDALRMEVQDADFPVSITLIKPAAINTPFPHHARNYMDQEPKLPPPVYPPEEVAHAILYAATHPGERDIYVGGFGKTLSTVNKHAPRTVDRLNEKVMMDQQRRDEPPRHPEGALYEGRGRGVVHGDHPGRVMKTSLYTRASLRPFVTGAVVGVVGLAAAALLNNGRS